MPKLTKRVVDTLQPKEKEFQARDTELKGFGVRVSPKGRKTYFVQFRDQDGNQGKTKIGVHGPLTAEQARKQARKLLLEISQGRNPSLDAKQNRATPTVGELCDRFLAEHVPARCAPSTQKEYERNIRLFIKPALGKMKVSKVTRKDIDGLHLAYQHIPYQSNRNLQLLSSLFTKAEVWGYRPDRSNPCYQVKKFKEEKRKRYLSTNELQRLGQTLRDCEKDKSESSSAINAIWLLLLTGCRLSEILTLKWDYISDDHIWLPTSKTGPKPIYLRSTVIDSLRRIERLPDNPYVIAGKKPGSHLTDLQRPWRRIRALAGLNDVRIHDLRHTFASIAVGLGESLHMTGALLGHSQYQTTQRYAHRAADPVKQSGEKVSNEIARLLGQT